MGRTQNKRKNLKRCAVLYKEEIKREPNQLKDDEPLEILTSPMQINYSTMIYTPQKGCNHNAILKKKISDMM